MTFTVSQPTGNPTQTFSFTDTLPSGLVIATPNGLGGTCTIAAGSRTATAGTNVITITSNQITNPATSCTLTVNVTNSATPSTTACPNAANTNGNGQISATTNLTAAIANSGGGTAGACVTVTAATPTVNKAFGSTLAVGGTSTLTFTVSQPANNPTQTFSFTDTLPTGLVIAPTPNVGGTCTLGGGSRTAVAGSGSITITNNQITNPATTCTLTVDVTTAAAPTVGV
jgi:fimbrial isopeptide formation D2 family protein